MRKIDWPQVAALAVVCAAVVSLLVLLDTAKVEAWLALVPGILGAIGMLYSMHRGHWRGPPPTGTVDSSRSRAERRERGTMPPPALAVLFAVGVACIPAGCTPAQKAAFEAALLSGLEQAAKAAGRALLSEAERALKFGDETAGGEE